MEFREFGTASLRGITYCAYLTIRCFLQKNWLPGETLLTLFSTNFYSDYYKALMKLSPEGEADFELDFQLVELQFPLSSLLAATSI